MSSLAEFLLYGAPWWLQAFFGALAVLLVLLPLARLVGLPRALRLGTAAGAVLAVLATLSRARQRGWADAHAKGDRDAQDALEKAAAARSDADRRSADAGRLRDDDGYRRD